jgi:hypothetical protein
MEVNGQFHGPAALPPEKEHPAPIGYEAGWAPNVNSSTSKIAGAGSSKQCNREE